MAPNTTLRLCRVRSNPASVRVPRPTWQPLRQPFVSSSVPLLHLLLTHTSLLPGAPALPCFPDVLYSCLQFTRTSFLPPQEVLLAVNKCENVAKADTMAADFWELGLQPMTVRWGDQKWVAG